LTYTSLTYILPLFTFVETKLFTRLVSAYLSEDEYSKVQTTLSTDPECGPVIPGSGGVRKLRWGQPGRGKRSGVRIVYYVKRNDGVIWMLTIYAKNEATNLPAGTLRKIREEIDG
jgi:mRNA-degrading endonuclease RelE of RelBE toxin-antitoxin system